jgi:uncharacterized Zn finger protein (UPF0148 family)
MGTLLLSGWAMLAESCDDCNVPLMRNPAKTIDLCCTCKQEIPVVKKAPLLKKEDQSKLEQEK